MKAKTLRLADGHEYFTTSIDGGRTWSTPVTVGASAGQITINEWWNDGSIAADSAGDLYATWDTQGESGSQKTDIGWVSFSNDGGDEWSSPVQATPDRKDVPHITEVTGAGPGKASVAWLSSSNPRGTLSTYGHSRSAPTEGREMDVECGSDLASVRKPEAFPATPSAWRPSHQRHSR